MALLELENVDVFYGAIHALRGVSFQVGEGEIVTLIGANGAGKTTTLRAVSGMLRPSTGYIRYGGEEIAGLRPHKLVARGLCHAPEGRGIFPNLSVTENLRLGAFLRRDEEGIRRDLERGFSLFPRLRERATQMAGTLSGGEQQMLAIARALMSSPRLLLVDEPSVGLSPLLVSNTITMIQELKRKHGLTVLMAEQNFHQAIRIADRGYIVVHGEIVFEGRSVAELEGNALVKNYYLGTG